MDNPFRLTPLESVDLFAGRKTEISTIQYLLRKKRVPSFMLVGERGMGKTSLLNYISIYSRVEKLLPIRIDLTKENSSDTVTFFRNIFFQLCNSVIDKDFLGGKGGVIHNILRKYQNKDISLEDKERIFEILNLVEEFNNDSFIRDCNKILEDMDSLVANKAIIFLIDEAEKIYDNTNIIENLRFIIQREDIRVKFIFCGDTTYKDKEWERIFQSNRGVLEVIEVDNFRTHRDVEDYFEKNLRSVGWDIEKDLNKEKKFKKFKKTCFELFLLTNGKPSYISRIAYKMYESVERGQSKYMIFDKEVKREIKDMLSRDGNLSLNIIDTIDGLSPKHLAWLKLIFECQFHKLNYFYNVLKYLFIGTENEMSLGEFETFIEKMNEYKLIILEKHKEEIIDDNIGFKTPFIKREFLDRRFLVRFPDSEDDATKLWLQLSSNYIFAYLDPQRKLVQNIFRRFVSQVSGYVSSMIKVGDESLEVIKKVFDENYTEIGLLDFPDISKLYDLLKSINSTKDVKSAPRLLVISLMKANGSRANYICWGNDHENHLVSITFTERIQNEWRKMYESNSGPNDIESIEFSARSFSKFVIINFENSLLNQNDTKIQKLVIESRILNLVQYFNKKEKDKDFEETYNLVFDCFSKGLPIGLVGYNNLGFICMYRNDLSKAKILFDEAYKVFDNINFKKSIEDLNPRLLLYNMAILALKVGDFEEARNYLMMIEDYVEEVDNEVNAFLIKAKLSDTGNFEFDLFEDCNLRDAIADVSGLLGP